MNEIPELDSLAQFASIGKTFIYIFCFLAPGMNVCRISNPFIRGLLTLEVKKAIYIH